MSSLKRQEEREGEGTGRTEKALCWQTWGTERVKLGPAFEEFLAVQLNAAGVLKYTLPSSLPKLQGTEEAAEKGWW